MVSSGVATVQEEVRRDVQVRRLEPGNARISEGEHSTLRCEFADGGICKGVSAIRLFPATSPERFISLRQHDADGKAEEIGIIEDLADFPAEVQGLVRLSLCRHYHEQIVMRIYNARYRYELLFFDIETQRGREQLLMRWEYDRARDYGPKGKALLDVNENRYIIPDVSALPPADHRRFTRFIYW